MNTNKHTTAFPAQSVQDNFGKIFTPFPGFTKYEYVLLQMAITGVNSDFTFNDNVPIEKLADYVMEGAKVLTDAYFNALEQIDAKKDTPIVNLIK